jgi:uncharacterized membrane protein
MIRLSLVHFLMALAKEAMTDLIRVGSSRRGRMTVSESTGTTLKNLHE